MQRKLNLNFTHVSKWLAKFLMKSFTVPPLCLWKCTAEASAHFYHWCSHREVRHVHSSTWKFDIGNQNTLRSLPVRSTIGYKDKKCHRQYLLNSLCTVTCAALTKPASAGPRVAEGAQGQRVLAESRVVPAQVPHLDHAAREKHQCLQLPHFPSHADTAFEEHRSQGAHDWGVSSAKETTAEQEQSRAVLKAKHCSAGHGWGGSPAFCSQHMTEQEPRSQLPSTSKRKHMDVFILLTSSFKN